MGEEFHCHPYGTKLFTVYFENKKRLTVNYPILERKYPALFDIICLDQYEWIDIDVLHSIFPHIEFTEIINVNMCMQTIRNIASHRSILFTSEKGSWNLKKMRIKAMYKK